MLAFCVLVWFCFCCCGVCVRGGWWWFVVALGVVWGFFCESQTANVLILIVTGWIHFSNKQGHRDAALQTVYIYWFFTTR